MSGIVKKVIRKLRIIPQDIYAFSHKDKIILYDKMRPTEANRVNLHWCSENRVDSKENVGDCLAVPIFEYLKKRGNVVEQNELKNTKHLYTVGSILFFGYQDATVWGSGILCNPKFMWYKPKLDVRMVRGPRTREILQSKGYNCPESYGDPAILMPLIYKPHNVIKKRKYSVIMHKSSKTHVENQIEILRVGYKEFINEIVESELIISTSLHGIILSEVYGVPAILLIDDRDDFNLLKYEDYYLSTGRAKYTVAKSIEEALNLIPTEIPNFETIREKMIATFPYDLWDDIMVK